MHPENELILYHYGELSPEKERELLAHLDICAGCRGRLEMMKKASACVNESAIEPPRAVLDAVIREATTATKATKATKATETTTEATKTVSRTRIVRWAFAGALASILAVSLWFTGREDAGQFAWKDSIEEEIESLDCDLTEFQMSLDSAYAWSGFDLEYSGIESEGESVENSMKWREL